MVQGETKICYRMTGEAFRQEMDRRGVFHELLTRYAQALVGFMMQSTACNAVHSVEQRFAGKALRLDQVQGCSWLNRTEIPVTGLSSASRNRAQKSVAPPALTTAIRIVFSPLLSVTRFETPSSITACRSP